MPSVAWHFRCLPATVHCIIILGFFCIAFGELHRLHSNNHESDVKHVGLARLIVQWVVALCMVLLQTLACAYPIRLCWATFWTTRAIAILVDRRGPVATKKTIGAAHVILLPAFKETQDTLRKTLDVLASHRAAERHYNVYLAMEESDPNAETLATMLAISFGTKFHSIQYTIHPKGLVGEAQGKSSNVSWAAKVVENNYAGRPLSDNVIITVMDADTHLSARYFRQLSRLHEDNTTPAEATLYMPPIVFDRNAHKVPAFVRMADLLWCGAALSGIYPGSNVGPPASVYSVPLPLARRVGAWDTGPESIGEDLHMYLKCYFATRGQLHIRPIYAPASQCNACSEGCGFRGYCQSLQARWKQAVRHMWGSVDTGYAVQRGLQVWNNLETDRTPQKHLSWHVLLIYHRLFEAHFLPILLPLSVLSSAIYPWFIPPVITPWSLLIAFRATAYLRNVAFITMLFWYFLYEHYHWLCVTTREFDMRKAGLYNEAEFSHRLSSKYWIDWFAFPVAGVIFGTVPMIVAQWSHFFTESLVYQVTAKPMRNIVNVV